MFESRRHTAALIVAATFTLACTKAQAAKILVNFSVPITFTAPSSVNTYDFTVPGFNPSLGTLNSIGLEVGEDYGTSTLDWTIRNNGAATVSGFNAYTETYSVKLLRGDNSAQLQSAGGSGSATFGFSLAPGQQTVIRATGAGGSTGSSTSSTTNKTFFTRVGGGDVPLKIQSTGAGLSLNPNLSIVSQTGTIETFAYGTLTYNYTSSNTTPPPATPIVISSSNTATLSAASEIDWYSFQYGTGALTIDTIGSTLSDNDTYIALYNSTGTRVAQNDDATGLGHLSKISLANGAIPAGTYYIAVAGYGTSTSFANGFDAFSNGDETGTYKLNLTGTPVPEPAALVVAFAGLLLPSRNRRLAGRAFDRVPH